MFRDATSFNQPLDNWDVSSIGTCFAMFHTATSFNQNINSWDVSSVGTCFSMFFGASSFNQPLNNWDMSNVFWLDGMFKNATSFNQPINSWNLSNASKMNRMFEGATSFNQPLNNWDVSGVTEMDMFFKDATSFNQDISDWCVELIPNEPIEFSLNSPLQENFKPDWGANCTLNIEEFNIFSNLNIYPNPVEKQLNFSFNQAYSPTETELILYDIQGKEIFQNTYKQLPDYIDLSSLQKGVYLLKLISGEQISVRRIIKE
jgi:surface protein